MLTRRLKKRFEDARKKVGNVVDSAVDAGKNAVDKVKDKADEILEEKELTFEDAQEELIDDLKKGLRVFDYLDLNDDEVKNIKSKITTTAIEQLERIFA